MTSLVLGITFLLFEITLMLTNEKINLGDYENEPGKFPFIRYIEYTST